MIKSLLLALDSHLPAASSCVCGGLSGGGAEVCVGWGRQKRQGKRGV